MGIRLRMTISGILLAAALLVTATAAAEPLLHISPATTFYFYQERDLFGNTLDRSRGIMDLNMGLLGREDALDYEIYIYLRVRGEFGQDLTEAAKLADQGRVQFDLMLAQLSLPRIYNALDVTLGRQLVSDECGQNLVDGGSLSFWRNWYVGARFVAGAVVRNTDNRTLGAYDYSLPNFNPFALEGPLPDEGPDQGALLGVSLFTTNLPSTYAQVSWRRTYSGWDLEDDRLAAMVRQDFLDRALSLHAGAEGNFYTMEWQRVEFGAAGRYAGVELAASYGYELPLFPAYSIFVVFPYVAHKDFGLSVSVTTWPQLTGSLDYHRRFYDDSALFPTAFSPEGQFADELDARLTWRPEGLPLELMVWATGSMGYGGQFASLNGRLRAWFLEDRLTLTAMASGQHYRQVTMYDQLAPGAVYGFGGGGVLGASWRFIREVLASASIEYNGNPVTARDLRVLLSLAVEAQP